MGAIRSLPSTLYKYVSYFTKVCFSGLRHGITIRGLSELKVSIEFLLE